MPKPAERDSLLRAILHNKRHSDLCKPISPAWCRYRLFPLLEDRPQTKRENSPGADLPAKLPCTSLICCTFLLFCVYVHLHRQYFCPTNIHFLFLHTGQPLQEAFIRMKLFCRPIDLSGVSTVVYHLPNGPSLSLRIEGIEEYLDLELELGHVCDTSDIDGVLHFFPRGNA